MSYGPGASLRSGGGFVDGIPRVLHQILGVLLQVDICTGHSDAVSTGHVSYSDVSNPALSWPEEILLGTAACIAQAITSLADVHEIAKLIDIVKGRHSAWCASLVGIHGCIADNFHLVPKACSLATALAAIWNSLPGVFWSMALPTSLGSVWPNCLFSDAPMSLKEGRLSVFRSLASACALRSTATAGPEKNDKVSRAYKCVMKSHHR